MYTNNYYYKLICESLIGEEIIGHHPDIYYLELILEHYGVTYQTVKCKGKYLKDWYVALTHQTVTKSHPNIYYLRLIANFLTNSILPWRTENYYLQLISKSIGVGVTVQLVADPSTIELGESTTLTATVLDADREPIRNAMVTIYKGESGLATIFTDENGQIECTYTPSSVGEYRLYAKYLNTQSSQIEVNVIDTLTNLTVSRPVNDTRVTPTDTVSVSGYLEDTNGNRLSDKTIKVKLGSTVLATTTTGSIGVYSTSFNASSLSDGSNTITITFEGDSSHKSSTATRTVIREVYQITLSEANNKTILSYANSDTASLQATLTYGGVAVPDNPITFFTGVANTYDTQTRLDEDWSNGFKIRVEGDSKRLIIGNGTTTQIYYYSKSGGNNVEIITNGQKVAFLSCGDWLKYDNGVLYGSNGNSLDISSYNIDFTKNTISGGTLYRGVIGVATTDNTGKATIIYNSQGIGDIGFNAGWSMFVSETFAIEDCDYWNDGSSVGTLQIDSGVSCTSNDSYITITTSTSGEKYVYLPVNLPSAFEFSFELAENGTGNPYAWIIDSNYYGAAGGTTSQFAKINDGGPNVNIPAVKGGVVTMTYQNGTLTVEYDNTQLNSKSASVTGKPIGFYTNSGRVQYLKNIKLKPL